MPRVVKPEERRRARHPKTRTGCKTCKIRRVKCDEAKPSCSRCTSTGRTCDGYEAPNAGNSKLDHYLDPLSAVFRSTKEKQAFKFFQERTSQQLCGYHGCELWDRTILQAAFLDDGIRYAVVALGSIHQDYEKFGESWRLTDEFALKQYSLSIRQHLDNLSAGKYDIGKVDSYIASCMIFTCIELLQGHYLSAFSLVKRAVQLFYEANGDLRRRSPWPLEAFEVLLSRLQKQAIGLIGQSAVGSTTPPRLMMATKPDIPEQFESISEARDYLEFFTNTQALAKPPTSDYTAGGTPRDTRRLREDMDILNQWSTSFEALLVSLGEITSHRDFQAITVLKIWREMINIGVSINLDHPNHREDETARDNYEDRCRTIVTLAEAVVENSLSTSNSPSRITHQITLDLGIVGPLYDIARLCRDPTIRRKAISLLRTHSCREGLWDSLLAARVAERHMELEEGSVAEVNAASDIPGWARINTVLPRFQHGERWASVVYTRQKPYDGSEPQVFREVLEW